MMDGLDAAVAAAGPESSPLCGDCAPSSPPEAKKGYGEGEEDLSDDCYDDDAEDEEDEDEEEEGRPRAPQTSPLLRLDTEVLAQVLGFLAPAEALAAASAPVCKDWHDSVAFQPELWRILCYQDPFGASTKASRGECPEEDEEDESSSFDSSEDSDDEDDDESLDMEHEIKRTFGRHRVLFSRFVRCQRYLARIKEDALAGRPPSVIEYVTNENSKTSTDLHRFLARARHASKGPPSTGSATPPPPPTAALATSAPACSEPIACADDGRSRHNKRELPPPAEQHQSPPAPKKARFGASALTQRLMLGAGAAGTAAYAEHQPSRAALPWSCAIYSVANWMVAYPRALGIQSLCLDALPCLMEDERQRLVAQRAGLADLVLAAMVRFPHAAKLQTAALHAIVLLARPIGGREGQLFSLSMAAQQPSPGSPSSRAFSGRNDGGRGGVQVVLDAMRRFPDDESLQAMGCWSLVNLALAPDQKDLLLRSGGMSAILSSMEHHPHSAEVQFRALFSLINLVIPASAAPAPSLPNSIGGGYGLTASVVDQTVERVVASMKHFCSNVTILNRACLVLHNLSLTPDHHSFLLLDADCYHLLEWCLASYPTDAVLQQSASAALQRLQTTLSRHESLRRRFQARHSERKTALEAELLLPEDELWISDSEGESSLVGSDIDGDDED